MKTILAPWSYIASILYHDFYWYPAHRELLQKALQSDWGRLFHNWEQLALPPDDLVSSGRPAYNAMRSIAGRKDVGSKTGKIRPEYKLESKAHFRQAMKILGQCIREAPEFSARKRR